LERRSAIQEALLKNKWAFIRFTVSTCLLFYQYFNSIRLNDYEGVNFLAFWRGLRKKRFLAETDCIFTKERIFRYLSLRPPARREALATFHGGERMLVNAPAPPRVTTFGGYPATGGRYKSRQASQRQWGRVRVRARTRGAEIRGRGDGRKRERERKRERARVCVCVCESRDPPPGSHNPRARIVCMPSPPPPS